MGWLPPWSYKNNSMAPTEGRVGKPGRRWDCRIGTPYFVISLTQRNPVAVMHNTELTSRLKHLCVAAVTLRKHHVFFCCIVHDAYPA